MKGKFLTTAILAAMLVGSNAMASIARQAVMGNHQVFTTTAAAGTATTSSALVNGSLWYDDDYNVFYNPSYVNDNKNFVTIQKGFEGGFFKSAFENFVYGVYMNRGGNGNAGANYGQSGFVAPGYRAVTQMTSNVSTSQLSTKRPIDLFFGGDTGVKWGLHLAWAYNRDQLGGSQPNNADAEVTSRYWHLDFGLQFMGLEPFIGATVFSKYQNTITAERGAGDLNEFNTGFRYKYEGWTPYFAFSKTRNSGTSAASLISQAQTRFNNYAFGLGHDTKIADGVHLYKHVGFIMSSVQDDTASATTTVAGGPTTAVANQRFTDTVVPINVALEAEATSWLTLRAGMAYDFINQRKYSATNTTTGNTTSLNDKVASGGTNSAKFRIGSTLKFGKLHLDSAFGNGASGTASNGETLDNSAVGFDGQLFALLSASYHW